MTVASNRRAALSRTFSLAAIGALIATPAMAIFLATNLANAGNLAFNMIFSRLLTPSQFHDLAVVLTLMLGVMSVLGAAQMAVSQMAARGLGQEPTLAALPRLNLIFFGILCLMVPFLVPASMSNSVTGALGIESGALLPVLLFALPVTAPLSLARGAALGIVSVRGMVLSANLEMIVRLIGAIVAWQLGLGMAGISGALVLSVIAGWLPVRGAIRKSIGPKSAPAPLSPLLKRLLLLCWPFALLQLAQVGHLDVDLLISASVLSKSDAGLVAGLSLIQRLQFFACFGLAGILLPTVTAAARDGRPVLRPAMPVFALVLGTGAALFVAAILIPEQVVTLIAGPAYAGAAPQLLFSVSAAFAFTGSYLLATMLAALGDRRGVALVVIALPISVTALWIGGQSGGLNGMIGTKAIAQLILLVGSLLLTSRVLVKRAS